VTSRSDWILATIGLEVRRAATHAGEHRLPAQFEAHDHSDTFMVEFWWWTGDEVRGIERFEVLPPINHGNRPGPPEPDLSTDYAPSDYAPSCSLPENTTLQIVVYPKGTHPEQRKGFGVAPGSFRSRREDERCIDDAQGVRRWGAL